MKSRFLLAATILVAGALCGCQTHAEKKYGYPAVIARMGESPGFPSQAAGFSRGDTVTYEPGMKNISVGYNFFSTTAQQAVTFYFYPKSEPYAQQIESEKKMIERFHEGAVVLSQEKQLLRKGHSTFEAFVANYRVEGVMLNRKQPLYSQLILIELPERYVKVRSTSPLNQAEEADRRVRELMQQIDWTKQP